MQRRLPLLSASAAELRSAAAVALPSPAALTALTPHVDSPPTHTKYYSFAHQQAKLHFFKQINEHKMKTVIF